MWGLYRVAQYNVAYSDLNFIINSAKHIQNNCYDYSSSNS